MAAIDTARSLYAAFAAGDGTALASLLSGTRFVEAAGGPYGGIYQGFSEIAANVFGPIGRDISGFTAKPDELLAIGDDRVLALGHYRGTGAAGPLDVPFAHLMKVGDDGTITHFEQFTDTYSFRQALG